MNRPGLKAVGEMDRTLRFVQDQIEVLTQHARNAGDGFDPAFVHLHALCLVHETARLLGPQRNLFSAEDLIDASPDWVRPASPAAVTP